MIHLLVQGDRERATKFAQRWLPSFEKDVFPDDAYRTSFVTDAENLELVVAWANNRNTSDFHAPGNLLTYHLSP